MADLRLASEQQAVESERQPPPSGRDQCVPQRALQMSRVFNRFRIRSFKRDERAVSAVEFALLAPMMIGLYLGGVEISEGISVDRKVTVAAGAVANLAAQNAVLSVADMTNVL